MTDNKTGVSTPHAELIAELMNPNNPKNEREHVAVREIERLREDVKVQEWNITPPDDTTNCYKCGTELMNAPGIGPFCPNKECDVVDASSGNKIEI